MDGTTIAVVGLFSLVIIGIVAVMIEIYVFWRDARMKKLEKQMNGVTDLLEDWIMAVDREQDQIWTYILNKR
jgi:hypothetical protein